MNTLHEKEGSIAVFLNCSIDENNNLVGIYDHDFVEGSPWNTDPNVNKFYGIRSFQTEVEKSLSKYTDSLNGRYVLIFYNCEWTGKIGAFNKEDYTGVRYVNALSEQGLCILKKDGTYDFVPDPDFKEKDIVFAGNFKYTTD